MRLGDQGLSLSGSFTYAWAKPSIANARVLANTLLSNVELGYPLVRRQAETVRGAIGFDVINQKVEVDAQPSAATVFESPTARIGIDAAGTDYGDAGYSAAAPPWHIFAQVDLRQGIDGLGATDCSVSANCRVPTSRPAGRPGATVLRGLVNSEFRPSSLLTFAFNLRAQYAWKPLLSFEEFAAGNYTVGRGYDPGKPAGRPRHRNPARASLRQPGSHGAKRAAIEGYTFWDHAEIHNLDTALSGPSTHLDSVGGGARINFDRFALDAGLAVPLSRAGPSDKKPSPRLLISLTTRLFPWQY